MQKSSGAVILVSHDRAFINNVTNRTLEISCGKVVDYKVAYNDFVKLRAERREQQLRAYENQQKEIADIKDFIERFRYKATKAVQVQSRIKQLERIVPIEVDEVDNSALRLKFPPCMRSGDYPVICEQVRKDYGEHCVFSKVDLTIKRGEKVAFGGKGTIQFKMLGVPEEMYKSASLFNHVVIQPGCSIGYHTHEHETEFYYILKGEAVFNDNGTEVLFHAGDVGVTGNGDGHGIENRSNEPVEMIALIVLE